MTEEMNKKRSGQQSAVWLNDELRAMVDRFINERGFDTVSEVIKQSIRVYYAKEFPAYVESKASIPRTPEARAENEIRKREHKDKLVKDRLLAIAEKLGGTVDKNDGGNLVCRYFTYDRKNRYEQELPLDFLTEDLIETQYSPSREDVEKRQAEGKVNY